MTIELKIRREGNYWVFDDEEKGIKSEPFVEGTDKLIDGLIPKKYWNREHTIVASDEDLKGCSPKYVASLTEFDEETKWSTYYSLGFGSHRLCPVLLQYFNPPPKMITFSII